MKPSTSIKGIFVLAAVLGTCLVSCAHKSGRIKKEAPRPVQVQQAPASNKVEVSSKRGDSNKLDGAQIFSKYNRAVFMIYTTDGFQVYQGSGFFINNQGLAVSNYHVFKGTAIGAEGIKLPGDNQAYKVVEVIQSSESEDFILFRINVNNTPYIPIAQYKPQIGEKVYTIGSPKGLENTFSSGEVSQWRDKQLMQISANIDHGSSGGALINEYGEVVGITSGTFDDGSTANLNYAWSIDVIKPYVKYQ